MSEQLANNAEKMVHHETSEKTLPEAQHMEKSVTEENLSYDDPEEEPEIHVRTWIALASMFFLNLAQVFALQGPPAVVSDFVWSSFTLLNELALLHRDEPRQFSG